MSNLKPRWNLEDKDFWIDTFLGIVPGVLAEVPNYDSDDKLIPRQEFEDRVMERVELCAKATDKVLTEMQFRFWDNARGNVEDKVRFGGRGRNRGNGQDRGRNRKGIKT